MQRMNEKTKELIRDATFEPGFSTEDIDELTEFINENINGVEVAISQGSDVAVLDNLIVLKQQKGENSMKTQKLIFQQNAVLKRQAKCGKDARVWTAKTQSVPYPATFRIYSNPPKFRLTVENSCPGVDECRVGEFDSLEDAKVKAASLLKLEMVDGVISGYY